MMMQELYLALTDTRDHVEGLSFFPLVSIRQILGDAGLRVVD